MSGQKQKHTYESLGIKLVALRDIGLQIDAEISKKRYNKQRLADLTCKQRELTVYILENYPKIVSKEIK